jgi:thiamine-phosphate pyrophosphorylase
VRSVREGVLRLVDANLNRATEGLRVADDLARFVLDDGGLSGEFKAIRHGVVEAVRATGVDAAARLLSRDTVGDVGTGLTASGEHKRADVASVAEAACGRAAEAMRAIEEACKLLGAAGSARDVEALRYRLYTAGARLTLKLSSGRSGRQWRLCVLVTEALCTQHSWERVVEEAIAGGADCLQLREKTMEAGEVLVRAKRLVEIARASARADGSRASVVINDRPDVALLAGADGVHVGQHDLPVAAVRKLAGFTLAVGVSTANLEQAKRARADGADSVGLGPMFVSGTKPKPELAGLGYLRAFLADAEVGNMPHLAISGITPENVGELWAAGCRGVAVSSVVCGARDPKAVCEKLLAGAAAERTA